MKILFTLVFVFLFTINTSAQGLAWAGHFQASSFQIIDGLAVDALGNSFVTGSFDGQTDFDLGPGSFTMSAQHMYDIFICKYNTNGKLVWAKRVGDQLQQRYTSIALDASANVFVTGAFEGIVDFDPGPGTFTMAASNPTTAPYNAFVMKLDSSGNFQWAKKFGWGNSFAQGNGITVDAAGNVLTTGFFQGTIDFDPGAPVYTLTHTFLKNSIYISKLSNSGNFVWARAITPTETSEGIAIGSDAANNVYVTGFFEGTGDFDPGAGVINLTTTGLWDIFVMKLDGGANVLWSKGFGGAGFDFPTAIGIDNTGNVLTTGSFSATVDFDPGAGTYPLISNGNSDSYISKLSGSGSFIWAKSFGGPLIDESMDLVIDNNNSIYTTGTFHGLVDFDPGAGTHTINAPGNDAYIHKLDAAGNYSTMYHFATASSSVGGIFGNVIGLDAINNIYWGGEVNSMVDFDPGPATYTLNPTGGYGLSFLSKLGNCVLPMAPIFSPNSTIVCEGSAITLTATASGTINWYIAPSATAVATGTSYVTPLLSAGVYSYQISATDLCGSSPMSAPLTMTVSTCTGMTNSDIESKLVFYPNPFSDVLRVKSPNQLERLVVKDLLGGKLLEEMYPSDIVSGTANLPEGVYLIEVLSGEKTHTFKVCKKH